LTISVVVAVTRATFVNATLAVAASAVEVALIVWTVLWLALAVASAALLASKFAPKERRPTILAMTNRRARPLRSSLFSVMRGDGRPGILSMVAGSVEGVIEIVMMSSPLGAFSEEGST